MNSIFSLVLLLVTAGSYLLVASLASRGITNSKSFLLGGRNFGLFSISLTLIATQLGAGMLFGTSAESYRLGFLGLAYNIGMALGLILLGLGMGGKLRSLNVTTTAEIFEKYYDSIFLRKVASLISIGTMAGILAAQMVASRQLFSSLFDLNEIWLAVFWIFVIAYTMTGGLKAIIATDILQVSLIVIIFTAVLFIVVPIESMTEVLKAPTKINKNDLWQNDFFSILLGPALFSLIEQDLAQRCFAAKNQRIASLSAIIAAFFLILYAFVPMMLGMYAQYIGINIESGQSPMIVLLEQTLPPIGLTFVACALLAAICSTADSLLGAASANLIADFQKNLEDKKSLLRSRVITFIVGTSALGIAFYFDNVISIIVKSYEISIGALFVPMIAAMFLKNNYRIAAFCAVFFGLLGFLIDVIFDLKVNSSLFALGFSLTAFLLAYLYKSRLQKA